MTITINLTQGFTTAVDDRDAHLGEFNWHASGPPRWIYAQRYRKQSDGSGSGNISLARTILARMLGRSLIHGETVDHINRNRLDNRRANLRVCTQAQNSLNRAKRPRRRGAVPSSQYIGVHWDKGRWVAKITFQGQYHNLGRFEDEVAAACAYDDMAQSLHGAYASLNFQ